MGPFIQEVHSNGIYHGLPVFSPDIKGLTAIVTGANGISGYYMTKVLSQSPERWKKIYCLSRRPPLVPDGLPRNAEFVSVDFMKSPEEIARVLSGEGVTADYVFFYSYINVPRSTGERLWPPEEMCQQNTPLLTNFLEAMSLAKISPKRIMLQTGAKNYGVHLGPIKVPQRETDPRVKFEPNFYYTQEDALLEWCKRDKCKYTIVVPNAITGAVPNAAHNLTLTLGLYCSVQAYLNRPIEFPADISDWEQPMDRSSATLNAYLEEWSVLIDQDSIAEKFNACDNSASTWADIWPQLASWFGTDWRGPRDETSITMNTPYDPPPRGFGGPKKVRLSFSFAEYAKRAEVKEAWSELVKKYDLRHQEFVEFEKMVGSFDAIGSLGTMYTNMDKAHKRGWFGTVDTTESLFEVLNDFVKLRIIPPLQGKVGLKV